MSAQRTAHQKAACARQPMRQMIAPLGLLMFTALSFSVAAWPGHPSQSTPSLGGSAPTMASAPRQHHVAGPAYHFRPGSTLSLRAQYCVGQAAQYHGVNADVLHAIILVESGGRPTAVNRNSNGTIDVGMAQINSIHFSELSRYGIQPEHLFDECIAAFVAAWHYARQVHRLGNTWQAIGAYHSRTPHLNERYQRLVFQRLVQIGAVGGAGGGNMAARAPGTQSAPVQPQPSSKVAAAPLYDSGEKR